MDREDIVKQLIILRTELIAEVTQKINGYISDIEKGHPVKEPNLCVSLKTDTAEMKGGKAILVSYKGEIRKTPTWKDVVAYALEVCNREEMYHQALLNARDMIAGRERTILSATADGMRSPLKVDEGLYVEAHYDTGTLLNVLKERIFNEIGFDYSDIKITYKRRI